jgi:hypothetical protein
MLMLTTIFFSLAINAIAVNLIIQSLVAYPIGKQNHLDIYLSDTVFLNLQIVAVIFALAGRLRGVVGKVGTRRRAPWGAGSFGTSLLIEYVSGEPPPPSKIHFCHSGWQVGGNSRRTGSVGGAGAASPVGQNMVSEEGGASCPDERKIELQGKIWQVRIY